MLNTQEPLPVARDRLGGLSVHSIFTTIQGEGPFAGECAVFIRLFGCNLQCPWCDTDYTSNKKEYTPHDILNMLQDMEAPNLVVITGGEPFRQNITPLCNLLTMYGFIVQVETNGTFYPGDEFPWGRVTTVCSPKTGKIHPKTAQFVTAYKYVLSHDSVAPDGLPGTALGHTTGATDRVARPPKDWRGPVFLQPMDAKDEDVNWQNIRAVVQSVMKNKGRYIMGVQMHKLTGLP